MNDKDLGIKTSGRSLAPNKHGNIYQPVRYKTLGIIFAAAKKLGIKQKYFFDLGCGKGRACFYALNLGVFSTVIGIDLNQKLLDQANLNRRGGLWPMFIKRDASSAVVLNNSIVFMFNPFDQVVLRSFLKINADKSFFIFYVNDKYKNVLKKHGLYLVWQDRKKKLSIWQGL